MAGVSPERLRQLFAQEAEVRLAELDRLLLRLEEDPDDDLVRSVFRELHTIKGSSAVAGLDTVSQYAHDLEELVEQVRGGRRPVTSELVDILLHGVDQLRAAVFAPRPVAEKAAGERSRGSLDPGDSAGPEDGIAHQAEASLPTPEASLPTPGAPPYEPSTPRRSPDVSGGVIMVPVERLDEYNRLVGEIMSAHLKVGRMLKDRFDVDPTVCTEFVELSRALNYLHDQAMRNQMVPVSTVTDQLQRSVRDLARVQGKRVRWETTGAETVLDRGVLLRLSESLVHVVRNAVDHGVEDPDERELAGKPAEATVRLHAMQLGADVIIAVTDDGRGMDPGRIGGAAGGLGLDTSGMNDQELLDLSFQHGLSTAPSVTDVSGRGVGLDVVRSNVEAAHGRVEVRSEAGVGTEFRIVVPITVAVLRCLLVEVARAVFALPLHRVLLTLGRGSAQDANAEGRPVVWVDDHPVPVTTLAESLGLGGEQSKGPVVVLADGPRRLGFVVDRLVGQRDVGIRALSPLLPPLPAVAGASCEVDGSIVVVLDPPGLIERVGQMGRRAAGPPAAPSDVARRTVLVVDDALIVRELQRTILERAGFEVRVASDGEQALEMLRQEPSELVVTDVEMPRMDGFALTEAIRAIPTLSNIPVLIVTSRASDADRQRGLDAGADGYIVKSAFDESNLLDAVHRLLGSHV